MHRYQHQGWVRRPREVESFLSTLANPLFKDAAPGLKGEGEGKVVLLYNYFTQALGHPWVPHLQAIGDCVSHGWSSGNDLLESENVVEDGATWLATTATELIYAGARVQIGGGQIRGDGAVGAWAAKLVTTLGTWYRIKYPDGEDFSTYSGQVARQLGSRGIPQALLSFGAEHIVKEVALVNSWEEVRDSVGSGHPVAVCSNIGFQRTRRDDEGFQRPQGVWNHCMLIAAVDDSYKRPGAVIINSHGDNVSGPTRLANPPGSWWTDADVIDRMVKQGDSFAMAGLSGFAKRKLNYVLY